MTTPTPPDLDAIRKRCEAASPGPWSSAAEWPFRIKDGDGWEILVPMSWDEDFNASFVTHAREDIPALLAALSTQQASAEAAEAWAKSATQAGAAALRMVRDAIGEIFGPAASMESDDAILLRGPEPHHEAEAIIAALQRVSEAAEASAAALRERVEKLEAFAESFNVTVVQESYYKDTYLHLNKPHTLSLRLLNGSDKSWLFADLEERRQAALLNEAS